MKYETMDLKNTDKLYSTFAEDDRQKIPNADTQEKKMEKISKRKHASSEMNAFLNLFKCNTGLGILAVPHTFYNSGLWLGLVFAPALGTLCIYCMYLLVISSRELRKKLNCGPMNVQNTVEEAFANGPKRCRKFAKTMKVVTIVAVMLFHTGTCCVFYVFVSQNIIEILKVLGGIHLTDLECNLCLILPFILISSIRYLKFISYVSTISAIAHTSSLAVILYFCTRDLNDPTTLPAIGKPWNIALFYGGIMFCFEGIGSILLIEGDMEDSSNFTRYNGTLVTTQALVVILHCAVGFFGYLQYGADVESAITLNLPPQNILAQFVTIFLIISIYLAFPIQFHVAVDSMRSILLTEEESETRKLIKEYVFRILVVLFCFTLATFVPFLGLFISLVGALGGSFIAIIAPVIVNLMTFWPEEGIPKLFLFKSLLIFFVGFMGSIFGVTSAVIGIIEAVKNSNTIYKLN